MRDPIHLRRPSSRLIVAVALSVATLAVAVAVAQQTPPGDGPRPSPEMNPPGHVMVGGMGAASQPSGIDAVPLTPSTPAVKGLQASLSRLATAVVTPHGHDDVLKLLSPADRQRLTAAPGVDWADADRAAEAFQSAWAAQFGQSFKIDDKIDIVFTEPTTHVELPPATGPAAGATTQPAAVRLIGPAGRSATVVRLVQDDAGDKGWRVVLPASATAASLHDSLLHQLTAVTADHAQWPTELGQAYVYTTQRLLSAVGEPVAVPR